MGKTNQRNEITFASFVFLPFPGEPFFNLCSAQQETQRDSIGELIKEKTQITDD